MKLPDPKELANSEWASIQRDKSRHPHRVLERVIIDAPDISEKLLTDGLLDFHNERLNKIPNIAKYPESSSWVEYFFNILKEFKKKSSLSELDIAVKYSLNDYLRFRGLRRIMPEMNEHCRVAYLPDSDHGQIHIKNVDDPFEDFLPELPITTWNESEKKIKLDGVGSGLHFDDEPEEIFPLPILQMMHYYADDLNGCIQFLERYKYFWGACNQVIHDWHGNSLAIEKSSYNFMEVFQPEEYGRSYCSGMVCRDPKSPQGIYQTEKRLEYIRHFNLEMDGPDMLFWNVCNEFDSFLADRLTKLGKYIKMDELLDLFLSDWPDGLNKNALKMHPKQNLIDYTLYTSVILNDEKTYMRWQRDIRTRLMPDEPEIYKF